MAKPLLLFMLGVLVTTSLGAQTLYGSHLLKLFHRELYSQHGVTDIGVHHIALSHLDRALQLNSSQALPFIGCSPAESLATVHLKELEVKNLIGADLVHIVRDVSSSSAQKELCILIYSSFESVKKLTGSGWEFDPIPPLLKIHQGFLSWMESPLSTQAAKEQFTPHFPPKLSEKEKHDEEGGNLEINVQFFPGVIFTQTDWDELLNTWSQQFETSHSFQHHLDAARVTEEHDEGIADKSAVYLSWELIRQRHSQNQDNNNFEYCEFPPSTNVEFHFDEQNIGGTVAKLIDLSGWKLESPPSTSTFCLLKLVEILSAQPAVISVNILQRPTLLNYDVRGLIQSGVASSAPLSAAGLLGEGQVIGISDSGLDDKSCFFWDNSDSYSSPYTTRNGGGSTLEPMRRKVVQYTSYADAYDSAAGHGTHVVGTAVGNSISADFSRANGVAPSAKVAFYDVQKDGQAYLNMPSLASALFPTLYRSGARVFSNSWGSAGADYYSDKCYDVDSYTYSNPDVLIIYAAGNSGASGVGSVFSPCTAKNALCVGSMDSRNDHDDGILTNNRVSYFSSQGPTGDGRIKPDVVGPGFKVVSALSGGQYGGDKFCGVYETFGTSMAAPGVAGSALLVREYFLNMWSSICLSSYSYCKSFIPSGYLLKGVIIHSGQAVASYSESSFDSKTDIASYNLGSPPDNVQGYGSVNLNAILPVSSSERGGQDLYVNDLFSLSGLHTASLQISVKSNKKPLKVTLAWYDKASAVGNAEQLLLLNLDLTVKSPSGVSYYGNGVKSDAANPQEQVYIAHPQSGVYTVSVSNVGSNAIKFALVVTCDGSVSSELSQGSSVAESGGDYSAQDFIDKFFDKTANLKLSPDIGREVTPLFSNYDLVKSFTLHHTLSANERVLLKTFELPDDSLDLFSIELSLDAHYCSGSEAFIFAIVVIAPNGETVQVGGYNEYFTLDRLWQRMSPVHWTATSVPADGGSYWRSTRYVVDMQLAQMGMYEVYIELMHDSWPTTTYNGNVKLNFVDASTAMSRSKSNGGFFSTLGAMTAGIFVFILAGAVVFTVALVLRKRRRIKMMEAVETSSISTDDGISLRRGATDKSKRIMNSTYKGDSDTPWSNLSGLLNRDEESSVSSSNDVVENPITQVDRKQTEVRHKRYNSARKKEAKSNV